MSENEIKKRLLALTEPVTPWLSKKGQGRAWGWDTIDDLQQRFEELAEQFPKLAAIIAAKVKQLDHARFVVWEKFNEGRSRQFEERNTVYVNDYLESKREKRRAEVALLLKAAAPMRASLSEEEWSAKVKSIQLAVFQQHKTRALELLQKRKSKGLPAYTVYEYLIDKMVSKLKWMYPRIAEPDEIRSMAQDRLIEKIVEKAQEPKVFAFHREMQVLEADGRVGKTDALDNLIYLHYREDDDDRVIKKRLKAEIKSLQRRQDIIHIIKSGTSISEQISLESQVQFKKQEMNYYLRPDSFFELALVELEKSSYFKPDHNLSPGGEGVLAIDDLDDETLAKLRNLTLRQVEQLIKSFNQQNRAVRNSSTRVKYKEEALAAYNAIQEKLNKAS